MSSGRRLAPALLTLVISAGLTALGFVVWEYRHVPVGITDPTSFEVADFISAMIIFPGMLGFLLSGVALVQRLLPPPQPAGSR